MKYPISSKAALLATALLLSLVSSSLSLAPPPPKFPALCSDASPEWCAANREVLCGVPLLRSACSYTCGLCQGHGQARTEPVQVGEKVAPQAVPVPASSESRARAGSARKVLGEGRKALWEQRRALWEGRRSLWGEKRVNWEVQRVLSEVKRVLWEGRRVLWEGRTLLDVKKRKPRPAKVDKFHLRTEGLALAKKTAFLSIYAFDVVSAQAVINLRRILEGMLAKSPAAVLQALKKYNATVAIIGKKQNITDLPPYAFLKGMYTFDGRPYWTIRGVGAPDTRFTVSATAEENLLFLSSDPYVPWEVTIVHEFAHTVDNVGLADQPKVLAAESSAYNATLKREAAEIRKHARPYGFSNVDEYWAVFTEAWFESIQRTDINLGIITRQQLKARDKALSSIYQSSAYGDGNWTYFGDKSLPHEPVACETQGAVLRRPRSRPPPRRSPIDDLRRKVATLNPHSIWHPS